MSIRLKSKGRWRVTIWKDGVRKEWIVRGSKEDAETFEARKRVGLETAGPRTTEAAASFSDFCAGSYKAHAQLKLRASTWKRKQIYVLATLVNFFGRLKLTDFTTDKIEKFMAHRKRQNMKASCINNELRVLHRILVVAQRLQIPVHIPAWDYLEVCKSRKVAFWTEDEVTRLLAATAEVSPDIYPMVLCLANTGMRCSEAMALTISDVNIPRQEICIQSKERRTTAMQGEDDEEKTKSANWRMVPVNDALLPFVSRVGKPDEPVFPCASTGRRFAYWPDRKFRRACQRAGLTGGPHKLRHSYASHFLKTTPDMFLLSKVLGHSHSRVTEIYAHLLPDSLAKARQAVVFSPAIRRAMVKASEKLATGEENEDMAGAPCIREVEMEYAVGGCP